MPAPIVIRNLSPETKKAANPEPGEPLIATKAELRDGSRGAVSEPDPVPQGVLLTENFDDQPDFTSTMHDAERGGRERWNGAILPDGWDAMFQGTQWSPETGYADKHASIEILAANADKARGGTGKSMVNWRESYGANWHFGSQAVNAGDYIKVQHLTADTYDTEVTQSLIIAGTTYTFTSRTAVDAGSVAPSGTGSSTTAFVTQTGHPLSTKVESNAIAVPTTGTAEPGTGALGDFSISPGGANSFNNWNNFASDSQMIRYTDQQQDELYLEFYISFSPNWYNRTNSLGVIAKIIRIGSYNSVGDPYNGAADALGPILFWDYKDTANVGIQNNFAYRGGPWGENYYGIDLASNGLDDETNFTSMTKGMAVGGGDPQVLDQVNGGWLADVGRYDYISHNHLYGPAGHWTKMAFYVKMNSAPGVADGVMMQFINDQRVKHDTTIPWIGTNIENKMVGWNYISLGGNDFFRPYPNAHQFEDWYSIDDVVVSNALPEGLV